MLIGHRRIGYLHIGRALWRGPRDFGIWLALIPRKNPPDCEYGFKLNVELVWRPPARVYEIIAMPPERRGRFPWEPLSSAGWTGREVAFRGWRGWQWPRFWTCWIPA